MDCNSLNFGVSKNNDDNDIHHRHPAGLSFWVGTLESNISTQSLSNPLNMPMVQRNFVSHNYSMGGDSGVVVGGSARMRSKGNVGEEEEEDDNDRFSSSGGGER